MLLPSFHCLSWAWSGQAMDGWGPPSHSDPRIEWSFRTEVPKTFISCAVPQKGVYLSQNVTPWFFFIIGGRQAPSSYYCVSFKLCEFIFLWPFLQSRTFESHYPTILPRQIDTLITCDRILSNPLAFSKPVIWFPHGQSPTLSLWWEQRWNCHIGEYNNNNMIVMYMNVFTKAVGGAVVGCVVGVGGVRGVVSVWGVPPVPPVPPVPGGGGVPPVPVPTSLNITSYLTLPSMEPLQINFSIYQFIVIGADINSAQCRYTWDHFPLKYILPRGCLPAAPGAIPENNIRLKINPDPPDNDIGPMAAFSLITPTKNCQEQKHLNDAPGGATLKILFLDNTWRLVRSHQNQLVLVIILLVSCSLCSHPGSPRDPPDWHWYVWTGPKDWQGGGGIFLMRPKMIKHVWISQENGIDHFTIAFALLVISSLSFHWRPKRQWRQWRWWLSLSFSGDAWFEVSEMLLLQANLEAMSFWAGDVDNPELRSSWPPGLCAKGKFSLKIRNGEVFWGSLSTLGSFLASIAPDYHWWQEKKGLAPWGQKKYVRKGCLRWGADTECLLSGCYPQRLPPGVVQIGRWITRCADIGEDERVGERRATINWLLRGLELMMMIINNAQMRKTPEYKWSEKWYFFVFYSISSNKTIEAIDN